MLKSKVVSIEDIILLLENKFPNKLPQKIISSDELSLKIGEQSVINYLRELEESLGRKPNNGKSNN